MDELVPVRSTLSLLPRTTRSQGEVQALDG